MWPSSKSANVSLHLEHRRSKQQKFEQARTVTKAIKNSGCRLLSLFYVHLSICSPRADGIAVGQPFVILGNKKGRTRFGPGVTDAFLQHEQSEPSGVLQLT